MQLWRERAGAAILLDDEPLGRGGEASIHAVSDDIGLVAKLFHQPTPERAAKLEAMLHDPPVNPPPADHVSIAWPIDRVLDDGQNIVGYVMPRLRGARSIHEFYNPAIRLKNCPLFHYGYLVRTARNLATAIWALHERDYVVGDLNESNLLVTTRALVTLVDADSIQVPAPGGGVFPCPVGRSDYTPPELQEAVFAEVQRRPEHDNFALGVLVFQLLMGGAHPFAGVYEGEGEPPGIAQRIAAGDWPYCRARGVPYRPGPHTPPWSTLPLPVQELMWGCFEEGHTRPETRPSAARWQHALKEAEDSMAFCPRNGQHLYHRGLPACPWCAIVDKRGRDLFPAAAKPARSASATQSGAMATVTADAKKTQTLEAPPVRASRARLPVAQPMPAEIFDLEPPRTLSPIVELGQALVRTSWRFILVAALIGSVLGLGYLVWLMWPAPGLERRFLPDQCRAIYSIRPFKLIGSQGYQELQARAPKLVTPLERQTVDRFGIPAGAIDRLTLARDNQGHEVAVVHTRTDISFAAIEKERRDSSVYLQLQYRVSNHGPYELVEESYERFPGKRVTGQTFCLPRPRLLLVGKRAQVEQILERNGDPVLDGPLGQVMADTDFNRPIAWAALLLGDLPSWPLPVDLSKVQASAGSVAVSERVDVRLVLLFPDSADAEKLRGTIVLGLTDWKRQLYLNPKVPPDPVQLLDFLETSQRGTQVRLQLSADSLLAAQAIIQLEQLQRQR